MPPHALLAASCVLALLCSAAWLHTLGAQGAAPGLACNATVSGPPRDKAACDSLALADLRLAEAQAMRVRDGDPPRAALLADVARAIAGLDRVAARRIAADLGAGMLAEIDERIVCLCLNDERFDEARRAAAEMPPGEERDWALARVAARLARELVAPARAVATALELAREIARPAPRFHALYAIAERQMERGDTAAARAMLRELEAVTARVTAAEERDAELRDLAWLSGRVGEPEIALRHADAISLLDRRARALTAMLYGPRALFSRRPDVAAALRRLAQDVLAMPDRRARAAVADQLVASLGGSAYAADLEPLRAAVEPEPPVPPSAADQAVALAATDVAAAVRAVEAIPDSERTGRHGRAYLRLARAVRSRDHDTSVALVLRARDAALVGGVAERQRDEILAEAAERLFDEARVEEGFRTGLAIRDTTLLREALSNAIPLSVGVDLSDSLAALRARLIASVPDVGVRSALERAVIAKRATELPVDRLDLAAERLRADSIATPVERARALRDIATAYTRRRDTTSARALRRAALDAAMRAAPPVWDETLAAQLVTSGDHAAAARWALALPTANARADALLDLAFTLGAPRGPHWRAYPWPWMPSVIAAGVCPYGF